MGGLKSQKTYRIGDVYRLAKSFRDVINNKPVSKLSLLAMNGDDIMNYFGLPQGKIIGEILNMLMNVVENNPEFNYRKQLFNITKDWMDIQHG